MSPSKSRGFTLLELMVVVAIIAILAIIAIPSYLAQVRKSRRSDAIATMNTVVLNEERWRTNCPSYAAFSEVYTATCALAGANFMAAPTSTYYTFTLAPAPTASQYVIVATAIGSQAKDNQFGTNCASLTICANLTTDPCLTSNSLRNPAACFGQN